MNNLVQVSACLLPLSLALYRQYEITIDLMMATLTNASQPITGRNSLAVRLDVDLNLRKISI